MSEIHCNEEWRAVVGLEGHYEVSSLGRVRSLPKWHTKKGGICKGRPNSLGYWQVTLRAEGTVRDRKIHRLVGEAFLGPLPTGLTTNHRDGNKANNAVSNLEYVTQKRNVQHAFEMGLCESQRERYTGAANPKAKLTADIVRRIRHEAATEDVSYVVLAGRHGITPENASLIVRNKSWKHLSLTEGA